MKERHKESEKATLSLANPKSSPNQDGNRFAANVRTRPTRVRESTCSKDANFGIGSNKTTFFRTTFFRTTRLRLVVLDVGNILAFEFVH